MVIFKSKPKKLEGDLKIELCIKSLYLRYLGVKIDANLSWQCNDLSIKPRANAVFFKIKYVSAEILRSIYFAIFSSLLSYCSVVYTQKLELFSSLWFYKKRWLELLILSKGISIPVAYLNKSQDKICLENILLVRKFDTNQFLKHVLVFLWINITMKPQVLEKLGL